MRFLFAFLLCLPSTALAQAAPRFLHHDSLPRIPGLSQIVEVPAGTRLVFISGQVPLDREGNLVGAGEFRRQAEQVFANLGHALGAVGASYADLVKITIFVTDVAHLPVLREVRDRHVNTAAPPASSLIEVPRLFRDGVMLEIEAVAAVPAR